MTSPIDVAYVEIKPNFRDFERELRTGIDRIMRDIARSADRTSDAVGRDFDKAGAQVAASMTAGAEVASSAFNRFSHNANREMDSIGRSAHENARDVGTSFTAALGPQALAGVAGGLNNVGNSVSSLGGLFSTKFLVMGTAIIGLLPAIIAVTAALAQLAGLVAIIPAGIGFLAAAIAPLVIGFQGFGAALKKSTVAGGGATVSTEQLANAEYRLTQAQKEARRAQEDVTRARADAKRQLEDLQQALLGAALDERSANLAILEAQKRVRESRRSSNRLERQEAALALDQARQNAEDIRIRNARLEEDAAKAAKKGVNGSDQVVAAMDRQQQAVHAVAEAQQALKTAQTGGAGGGGGIDTQAAALAALAPAARAVAKEFIALQPIFHAFQQAVQQALFVPLQGVLTKFANTTLPHIQDGMVKVAGSFGRLFAQIGEGLSTPKAGKFFDKLFDSTSRIIDKLAPSIMDILEAMADVTIAGLPFLERFAGAFGDALTSFAGFLEGAIKDGSFQTFIEDAFDTLKALGPMLQDIGRFLGEVFNPEAAHNGIVLIGVIGNIFSAGANVLHFFNTTLPQAVAHFEEVAGVAVFRFLEKIRGIPSAIGGFVGRFVSAGRDLIAGFFRGLNNVGSFVGNLAGNIGAAIKNVLNNLLYGINMAIYRLNSVIPFGFNVPYVNYLAQGGLVMGPTLAMVGEGGRKEAVIPLGDPRTAAALADAGMGGGQSITFGPGSVVVTFDGAVTAGEARTAGAAIGRGILDVLAARNVRTQMRTV